MPHADRDALLETMGLQAKYIQKKCAHVKHHGLLHTMLQAADRAAQSVTSARSAMTPPTDLGKPVLDSKASLFPLPGVQYPHALTQRLYLSAHWLRKFMHQDADLTPRCRASSFLACTVRCNTAQTDNAY